MITSEETPPGSLVRTERLTLRPFKSADLDAYRTIRAKPGLSRFLPGGEAGASDADAKAQALVSAWSSEAWANGGFAPWAVVETESEKLIGHLGLRLVDELAAVELLYLLDDGAQGKGYATEGGRAALDVAERILRLERVVALALPDNAPSLAVMDRLGFSQVGPRHVFGLDVVLCEIRFG